MGCCLFKVEGLCAFLRLPWAMNILVRICRGLIQGVNEWKVVNTAQRLAAVFEDPQVTMQGRSSAWSLGGSHRRAAPVPEPGRSFHRGAGAVRRLPAGGITRPGHSSTHGHLKAALGSRLAHLGLCYIGVSAPLSWGTSSASPPAQSSPGEKAMLIAVGEEQRWQQDSPSF